MHEPKRGLSWNSLLWVVVNSETMNGIHDMGGMHGFGPVDPTDDEPFHSEWEKRAHALKVVLGVHDLYTTDESRSLGEQLPPEIYLSAGYWEIRGLITTEQLLIRHDILEPGEVDDRMENLDHVDVSDTSDPDLVDRVNTAISSNTTFDREPKSPQFAVGEEVVARNVHPEGHTRLPRYVRRARGEVIDFHGTQMLPDMAAEGNSDVGEPLYSVRFESRELWGEEYPHPDSVVLQLFEPYLREPSA